MSAQGMTADSPRVPRRSPAEIGRPAPPHRQFLSPPRASRTRWPVGLIGMLGLVLIVEGRVAGHWEKFTDPVAFSWRYALEAAGRSQGAEVLCLGDSLAKHGLVPTVITSATGKPAANLASAASPAPLTYFALRRALDAGAVPAAVVLEYKPSVLAGGPKVRAPYWAEALSAAELIDLTATSGSTALAAEVLLNAALPSFRGRHNIRDHLRAAASGESPRVSRLNAICRRNWSVNGGANVASRHPGFDGSVTEEVHRNLLSDRFAVHRVNAGYVRRTIELASGRGIATYLILPPFAPELLARRASTGAEAKYTAFARSLQERFPGLTVLDARGSGYPASVFVDASHLNRAGAVALSLDAAGAIGRGAPPGGWVELPQFRERPDPVPLEDVEQSRERLGIEWTP